MSGGQLNEGQIKMPNTSMLSIRPTVAEQMQPMIQQLMQPRPAPQFQSSMPSFQQLVQGGFNPASLQAMQRPAVQIPQNPFFGGAIPMDFLAPNMPIQAFAPRYRTGSANEAFFAQQAAAEAAKRAEAEAAAAEAARNQQSQSGGFYVNYFDSPSAYQPGFSLSDYGPDGSSAYVPTGWSGAFGQGA